MGYVGDAIALLDLVMDKAKVANTNDQEIISDLFLFNNKVGDTKITLDYHAEVFQCMHGGWKECHPMHDLRIEDGRFANSHTKSNPAVFHYNGKRDTELQSYRGTGADRVSCSAGGGKPHLTSMDKQLWYKKPSYAAQLQHELQTSKIHVSSLGKKYDLVINDICKGFVADASTTEAAAGQCRTWAKAYAVKPGESWGTLPLGMRKEWKAKGCDSASASPEPDPGAGTTPKMSTKCKAVLLQ
jgi:hypothetical protein